MSKDQNIAVIIRTNSQGLEKDLESLVLSEDGFRMEEPNGSERSDLMIYELGSNIDKDFDQTVNAELEIAYYTKLHLITAA